MYGNPSFLQFGPAFPFMLPLLLLLVVWTLIIKGYALWKAARNTQKAWFIALLIVNSIGILEIVYLVWFAKKPEAPAASLSVPEQH